MPVRQISLRHADGPRIDALVEQAMLVDLGLKVRILGRTGADLAEIVASDPFPGADPSRHLVLFLSGAPGAEVARDVDHLRSGP